MTVSDLATRRATVGGSDAAAACGLDPHRSRIMLWCEKRGLVPRAETEAMLWDQRLEPVILDVLGHAHDFELLPAPAEGFRDEQRPWMTGHPDAFGAKDGARYVVDAKTTGPWNGAAWDDYDAPTAYVLQLQHYMHLTGDELGLLACLVGGQKLLLRTVPRDDELIALMLACEDEFMRLVRHDIPPDPDGSDSAADALRLLHPVGREGLTMRLDGSSMKLLAEYRLRDRAYQAVKAQREEAAQQLKARMGAAEIALTPDDAIAARWTSTTRRAVDVTRLKRDRPEIASEYTTATPTRRFEVL